MKEDCKHYDLVMESHFNQIGEDSDGWPIGEEVWEPIGERCKIDKEPCEGCKQFETK